MKKIYLWTLRHPDAVKGWVYLTEQAAKDSLESAIKKLKKQKPNLDIDAFIIEPYHIMDSNLLNPLKETLPELFL